MPQDTGDMSATVPAAPYGVGIGCQGGGSHTAFTAGVLRTLLEDGRAEVRALSGTSGGAVCAAAAWSGLVGPDGSAKKAIDHLNTFWEQNRTPPYLVGREVAVLTWMRLMGAMGLSPEMSAYYNPSDPRQEFLRLLECIPFDEVARERITDSDPRLLISAVDILTGEFRLFRSHRTPKHEADEITSTVVLASAALPFVYRAVRLGEGLYGDGAFAENPPLRKLIAAARRDVPFGGLDAVRDLEVVEPQDRPPVELWVIQVNPDSRAHEPVSTQDIRDRRNELTGNLSYLHEIDAIAHVNHLIKRKHLDARAQAVYAPVKIRVIRMAPEFAEPLDYESKFERDGAFIERLMDHGDQQARAFLTALDSPACDTLTALQHRDIWGRWLH